VSGPKAGPMYKILRSALNLEFLAIFKKSFALALSCSRHPLSARASVRLSRKLKEASTPCKCLSQPTDFPFCYRVSHFQLKASVDPVSMVLFHCPASSASHL